jgi:hypothetical protein
MPPYIVRKGKVLLDCSLKNALSFECLLYFTFIEGNVSIFVQEWSQTTLMDISEK